MRFLVDNMLGRLARWLRILGYDAVYSKSGINRADVQTDNDQDTIILTRNTKLFKNLGTNRALFIKDDYFRLQVRQVAQELDLNLEKNIFLSRCVECNEKLSPITKEEVEGKIPDYVFQTQSTFHQCKKCGRIYWQGTHYFQIENQVKYFWEKEE